MRHIRVSRPPFVEVWQDDLLDTPMYLDPDAPAAP
jgi:hypothetical protein